MTAEQEMALLRVIAELRISVAQRDTVIEQLQAQLEEAATPKED